MIYLGLLLEGDVVFLIVADRIIIGCCRLIAVSAASGSGPVTFRAEHLHPVTDYFSRVAIATILVLPFTRLEPALDKDRLPLGKIILGNFCKFPPQNNIVPLCFLFPVTTLVLVFFSSAMEKLATPWPEVV